MYKITTGRSGTGFLADLLRANLSGAQMRHERAGSLDLGMNCPDASHLTRFNTRGNLPETRELWRRKLTHDAAATEQIHAEGTHLHAKAGLVENLDMIPDGARIVRVGQRRNLMRVVWSLHNRLGFTTFGFTWIFSLDPRYRNVIVDSRILRRYGAAGSAIWYVIEMQVRPAYYRRLVADMPWVTFNATSLEEIATDDGARRLFEAVTGEALRKVDLPPPASEPTRTHCGEGAREYVAKLLDSMKWRAQAIADACFDVGRRLAMPPWRKHA